MNKYIQYFSYLLKHKWFVALECFKYGLYWRGIIHDWSKFLPDEFIPYATYFYGGDKRKNAFYTPDQGTEEFNRAWLKHQHRNSHHWQHHILNMDDGSVHTLPIPDWDLVEMLCDWIGAGKGKGNGDVLSWYTTNRNKIKMDEWSREWIENEIGYRE